MEIFYKFLNLYIINEVTLTSNLIKLNKNDRYVIAVFEDNNLTQLFINYKFINIVSKNHYRFIFNDSWHDFTINGHPKINILKLVDDFNHAHLIDLVTTHYKINIENINNIYLDPSDCSIMKSNYKLINPNNLLKLSLK